ncbi:hypothetical protein L4C54_23210 [Vibrio lamellibrachiae]|uniref:hypothetical protein n=1 Tax=Vibrio lamellibrachiae TaxID=2910253 RepID=UPI003D144215
MNNLQKVGGVAALLNACLYITGFIFFGAFWHFPLEADVVQKLTFLAEHLVALSTINFFLYVAFGVLLAILVVALYYSLKDHAPVFSPLASVFGLIWVGLVIASGMIANVGLAAVIKLSVTDPEQAWSLWLAIDTVAEGIGGGNEVVGGLWVLLLSIAAIKNSKFSNNMNYLGVFVGLTGVMTVYPADIPAILFGLSQIVWFIWLGLTMLAAVNFSRNS